MACSVTRKMGTVESKPFVSKSRKIVSIKQWFVDNRAAVQDGLAKQVQTEPQCLKELFRDLLDKTGLTVPELCCQIRKNLFFEVQDGLYKFPTLNFVQWLSNKFTTADASSAVVPILGDWLFFNLNL